MAHRVAGGRACEQLGSGLLSDEVVPDAHRWPELAANKGNIALLHKSAELALIPADLAERTATAYRELRRMQHARRLNDLDNVVNEDELDVCRADVIALWDTVFGARAE